MDNGGVKSYASFKLVKGRGSLYEGVWPFYLSVLAGLCFIKEKDQGCGPVCVIGMGVASVFVSLIAGGVAFCTCQSQ